MRLTRQDGGDFTVTTTGAWVFGRRLAMQALAMLLCAGAARATPIALLDAGTAGFVGQAQQGPLDLPVVVGSYVEFATIFGTTTSDSTIPTSRRPSPRSSPTAASAFTWCGSPLPTTLRLIGNDGGSPGTRTGLQALIDIDEVAVVAIPGAVTAAVQAAMIAHCETVSDRLAILDPATTDNLDAIVAQRAGLVSANGHAALYFPWVQAAPAGESLLLPPSGFVAGVYARTAAHDPPIGEVMTTATGVSFTVNSAQPAMLNSAGDRRAPLLRRQRRAGLGRTDHRERSPVAVRLGPPRGRRHREVDPGRHRMVPAGTE